MQKFATYSEAHAAAKRAVRDMAKGSQAAALTAAQSRDALAAIERMQQFFQATGRRVSLLAAVSEWAEKSVKLGGRTLGEAVRGYLTTVDNVQRKDIKEAVEEFLGRRSGPGSPGAGRSRGTSRAGQEFGGRILCKVCAKILRITVFLKEFWCAWQDLNLHALRHYHLKVARLPIPPHAQRKCP